MRYGIKQFSQSAKAKVYHPALVSKEVMVGRNKLVVGETTLGHGF